MKKRYRRMIDALKDRDAAAQPPEWSLYIVRCCDDTLYTGIAKDVKARLEKHNSGKGAAYTRARRPVRLLYRENGLTRSEALVREAAIKRLPRARKEALTRPASA